MNLIFLQKNMFPKIGIMCLSSVLKQHGHNCEVLVQDLEPELMKKVISFKPDIVAFSCTTGSHKWALRTAYEIKRKLCTIIVFGGHHPTFFPDIIKSSAVDIVVRGESDIVLLELANHIRDRKSITRIQNVSVKKNGKIYNNSLRPLTGNLNALPFPDRWLYSKYAFFRKKKLISIVTGRGCPYSCSFCFNKPMRGIYKGKGKYVRKRSVRNVIAELIYIKKEGFAKRIIFEDEILNIDKQWLLDFCEEYKNKIRLPFSCAMRADIIDDETIRAVKEAGCFTVRFGIESGNENFRNNILKKCLSDRQILKAARIVKKHGLCLKTFSIFCSPGETLENAFETIELNRRIGADFAHSHVLQTYPQTEITKYSVCYGFLKDTNDFDGTECSAFTMNQLMMADKEEIYNLHKFLSLCVDFPMLLPLVKRLIMMKPNPAFDTVFKLVYYYKCIRYDKPGLLDSFYMALKIRNYFQQDR